MLQYLAKRLAVSLIVLFGLSLLTFFLIRLVPGNTATAMLGTRYSPKAAHHIEQQYGLNKPLPTQYVIWLNHLVHGDLGTATTGRSVASTLASAIPVTAELAALAMIFAIVTGLTLGILAAVFRNSLIDYIVSFVSMIGLSVPAFWLGTLLILLLSLTLGLLPAGRQVPLTVNPLANLQHMAMPAVALGAAVAAVITRMTRSAMLEVMQEDYVRTARAKGLSPTRVIIHHVLKNGLMPVLTISAIQVGYLLGGSIVIEQVFSLSGVGRLILRSVTERDYPLLQAAILLIGIAFLLINFITDMLYAAIDPRLRV